MCGSYTAHIFPWMIQLAFILIDMAERHELLRMLLLQRLNWCVINVVYMLIHNLIYTHIIKMVNILWVGLSVVLDFQYYT